MEGEGAGRFEPKDAADKYSKEGMWLAMNCDPDFFFFA
jgi:hypothetical protein